MDSYASEAHAQLIIITDQIQSDYNLSNEAMIDICEELLSGYKTKKYAELSLRVRDNLKRICQQVGIP